MAARGNSKRGMRQSQATMSREANQAVPRAHRGRGRVDLSSCHGKNPLAENVLGVGPFNMFAGIRLLRLAEELFARGNQGS